MRVARPSESVAPYVATPPTPPLASTTGAPSTEPSPFAGVLRTIGHELDKGEALTERAIQGGAGAAHLSPAQLIGLQAGVYRYSEAVDLVTKVVDRATQAVKTTLQNQ
jgi:hypothetical protein